MKKKYRIRKGSPAWYCQKYWKPAVVALVATLMVVATSAFSTEKEPVQPEVQETYKTCLETNYEAHSTTWDVPLDADLQLYIFEVSEQYGLEPELVLAVIGQESNYQSQKVGDDGESEGLMQIQKKWHSERMDKLGCYDLLDPYQNILVGVDYLAECINKGGLAWGLMAYNGGASYANAKTEQGVQTEYVEGVLMLYELLKGGELDV